MAAIIENYQFRFGIPKAEEMRAPVSNLPEGTTHVRFRFRPSDFVAVFVKHAGGFSEYTPEFIDGTWWINPDMEQARNVRR